MGKKSTKKEDAKNPEAKNTKETKDTKGANDTKSPKGKNLDAKKTDKNQEQNAPKAKRCILLVVSAIVAALAIAGGAVALTLLLSSKSPKEEEAPVVEEVPAKPKTDWIGAYYNRISLARSGSDETSEDESFWRDKNSKTSVSFYETATNEPPIMVANYTYRENSETRRATMIYSIRNEKIYYYDHKGDSQIIYAYSLEEGTYDYYLRETNKSEDTYLAIDSYFESKTLEHSSAKYTFTCKTGTGEGSCEETFVGEEVQASSFTYSTSLDLTELSSVMDEATEKYLKREEVASETHQDIDAKVAEIKEKIKKRAEEANKKTEKPVETPKPTTPAPVDTPAPSKPSEGYTPEPTPVDSPVAANSFKVGSRTMKFGTYGGVVSDTYDCGPMTLYPNYTFRWEDRRGQNIMIYTGSFRIGTASYGATGLYGAGTPVMIFNYTYPDGTSSNVEYVPYGDSLFTTEPGMCSWKHSDYGYPMSL